MRASLGSAFVSCDPLLCSCYWTVLCCCCVCICVLPLCAYPLCAVLFSLLLGKGQQRMGARHTQAARARACDRTRQGSQTQHTGHHHLHIVTVLYKAASPMRGTRGKCTTSGVCGQHTNSVHACAAMTIFKNQALFAAAGGGDRVLVQRQRLVVVRGCRRRLHIEQLGVHPLRGHDALAGRDGRRPC